VYQSAMLAQSCTLRYGSGVTRGFVVSRDPPSDRR
jgi:hypothetical protein